LSYLWAFDLKKKRGIAMGTKASDRQMCQAHCHKYTTCAVHWGRQCVRMGGTRIPRDNGKNRLTLDLAGEQVDVAVIAETGDGVS
jgi:hypothetical protein